MRVLADGQHRWHRPGRLFDFDNEADIARYVPAVLALAKEDPQDARQKAAKGRKFVEQRKQETMSLLGKALANTKG